MYVKERGQTVRFQRTAIKNKAIIQFQLFDHGIEPLFAEIVVDVIVPYNYKTTIFEFL